ncbi:MAG: restriction endonuclease [Myxococcales bacterium]|nr:restriction endonuclease [Myxococcales bacterium]
MTIEEVATWSVIQCPWCGEPNDLRVEFEDEGKWVQDCEVCCRPWLIEVRTHSGGRDVIVTRS